MTPYPARLTFFYLLTIEQNVETVGLPTYPSFLINVVCEWLSTRTYIRILYIGVGHRMLILYKAIGRSENPVGGVIMWLA